MGPANEIAPSPEPPSSELLSGARVLVVEDDFLIGLELAMILSDAGAVVIGPSQTVEAALKSADDQTLSAAILDIRLGPDTAAPIARRLTEHHVPFLFYTGQSKTDPMPAEWPDSPVISKPALPDALIRAVVALLNRPAAAFRH
jgi:DNA-binding response OmpR family regulator